MDLELQRLEVIISGRDQQISDLTRQKQQLLTKLLTAQQTVAKLKAQLQEPIQNKLTPDKQILQTLQHKIASSAHQILNLQNSNTKYQELLIKAQSELLSQHQQLMLHRLRVAQQGITSVEQHERIIQQYEIEIDGVLLEWESTVMSKELLAEENFSLKNKLSFKEEDINRRISYYFNQVSLLKNQMKNWEQRLHQRSGNFDLLTRGIMKENYQVREILEEKNNQILSFCEQYQYISTTKASDIHTIRNLRKQIQKKLSNYMRLLQKFQQAEKINEKLKEYQKQYLQKIGNFDQLIENMEILARNNAILSERLQDETKKVYEYEQTIIEGNQKIHLLLLNNQACHQLLFETRSFSNLFTNDIQIKIQGFLAQLEKRRATSESWMDVTELIAVNQKLLARLKNQP